MNEWRPLGVDVLVDQGRQARLILFVHRIPFLPELLQDCLDVNCIPEHDHIDDQPERTELIFLSFAVALPQFAPFRVLGINGTESCLRNSVLL